MSNPAPEKLRIVAFKDGEAWVAQCVDYDIAVQAADLPTLQRRMTAVISAEHQYTVANNGGPFVGIDPAPDYYESVWAEGVATALQGEVDFRIAA